MYKFIITFDFHYQLDNFEAWYSTEQLSATTKYKTCTIFFPIGDPKLPYLINKYANRDRVEIHLFLDNQEIF